MGRRLLRMKQVLSRTGVSRSWLYDAMRAKRFPQPVVLGPRMVAWPEDEIDAWVEAWISTRDNQASGSA